jgi:hypothetical protein
MISKVCCIHVRTERRWKGNTVLHLAPLNQCEVVKRLHVAKDRIHGPQLNNELSDFMSRARIRGQVSDCCFQNITCQQNSFFLILL